MRPFSRRLSLLLAAVLLGESACPPVSVGAEDPPAPCLLLKYSAASLSDELARSWMEEIPKTLREELRVRWVELPAPPRTEPDVHPAPKAADPESLARISRVVADARARLQDMDLRGARERLAAADGAVRAFLLADAVRTVRAEILLLQGILLLWEGDTAGAVSAFARSRVLRPGFTPDPALFSPSVRDAWARASQKGPPEAELLIQSIPPGAGIFLDGRKEGTTPGRVTIRSAGPVRLTILLPGFRPHERMGQWLPGDSEMVEAVLVPDRLAGLGETLVSGPAAGSAGPLLDGLASESGAERIAVLILGEREGRPVLDVFSYRRGSDAPVPLGRIGWKGGRKGAAAAARDAARLLIAEGWPAAPETARKAATPWYHRWWFWGLMGAAVAGAALAFGGGGGGSGDSTGSIGVDF